MDGTEDFSDEELLASLRLDYLQALENEDYSGIYYEIAPRFWGRFGRYYEEYAKSWKDLSLTRQPIRVVIDPSRLRELELNWMDQVLRGKIHLITWA